MPSLSISDYVTGLESAMNRYINTYLPLVQGFDGLVNLCLSVMEV